MLSKARIGMAVGAVIAGCGVGLAGAYVLGLGSGGGASVPDAAEREGGPGGQFALTSHRGEAVTDQTYRGRYTLVFFGFTHCPDICPTTLRDIADVLDRLGDDAEEVTPLFVTVDPGRDTVELLSGYVTFFDERIVGLTGSEQQIQAVVDTYGVWREIVPDPNDPNVYSVDHTAGIYFMDREGRFVRVFTHETPSDDMADSIRAVMRADASS